MPDDFEPRISDQTHFYTPCEGVECECPPSRISWFAPPCPGYITGQITDTITGDALSDIDIWVESFETGSFGEATTDEMGRYAIGPLDTGGNYILVSKGPGWSRNILKDGTLPSEGLVQNLFLARVGIIEGQALDEDGNIISGAQVLLYQSQPPSWVLAENSTGDDGIFCFCSVDAGLTYTVVVLHPDYSSVAAALTPISAHLPAEGSEIQIVMPSRAIISGTVLMGGLPIADVPINVLRPNGPLYEDLIAYTNEVGVFSISVSAPALYEVKIMESTLVSRSFQVAVTPGGQVSIPVTDLNALGSIAGKCIGSNGEDLANVVLSVLDAAEGYEVAEPAFTDEVGNFVISGVPALTALKMDFSLPSAHWSAVPLPISSTVSPNSVLTLNIQIDSVAPTCVINAPTDGQLVGSEVVVTVEAEDTGSIVGLQILVNDDIEDSFLLPAPYPQIIQHDFVLNLSNYSLSQSITLKAVAYDSAGNEGESPTISLSIS